MEVLKRGLVFCIKSIDLEVFKSWGEYDSSSKCWYYLGLFHMVKAELFAKIVFGYKLLTFFLKSFNLDVSLVL